MKKLLLRAGAFSLLPAACAFSGCAWIVGAGMNPDEDSGHRLNQKDNEERLERYRTGETTRQGEYEVIKNKIGPEAAGTPGAPLTVEELNARIERQKKLADKPE